MENENEKTYLKRVINEIKRIPRFILQHTLAALGIMLLFDLTGASTFHGFIAALGILLGIEIGQAKGKKFGSIFSWGTYKKIFNYVLSPEIVAQWFVPSVVILFLYLIL